MGMMVERDDKMRQKANILIISYFFLGGSSKSIFPHHVERRLDVLLIGQLLHPLVHAKRGNGCDIPSLPNGLISI